MSGGDITLDYTLVEEITAALRGVADDLTAVSAELVETAAAAAALPVAPGAPTAGALATWQAQVDVDAAAVAGAQTGLTGVAAELDQLVRNEKTVQEDGAYAVNQVDAGDAGGPAKAEDAGSPEKAGGGSGSW